MTKKVTATLKVTVTLALPRWMYAYEYYAKTVNFIGAIGDSHLGTSKVDVHIPVSHQKHNLYLHHR